ncbi:unnamed protein product, partial [Linum tenue]
AGEQLQLVLLLLFIVVFPSETQKDKADTRLQQQAPGVQGSPNAELGGNGYPKSGSCARNRESGWVLSWRLKWWRAPRMWRRSTSRGDMKFSISPTWLAPCHGQPLSRPGRLDSQGRPNGPIRREADCGQRFWRRLRWRG